MDVFPKPTANTMWIVFDDILSYISLEYIYIFNVKNEGIILYMQHVIMIARVYLVLEHKHPYKKF